MDQTQRLADRGGLAKVAGLDRSQKTFTRRRNPRFILRRRRQNLPRLIAAPEIHFAWLEPWCKPGIKPSEGGLSAPALNWPGCRGRKVSAVICEVRCSGVAMGGVRVFGQILHQREKCRRLADEKPHGGEEFDHPHGDAFGFSRANHGTWRQLTADKRAWLRHDQVGLEVLFAKTRRERA